MSTLRVSTLTIRLVAATKMRQHTLVWDKRHGDPLRRKTNRKHDVFNTPQQTDNTRYTNNCYRHTYRERRGIGLIRRKGTQVRT